MRAGPARRNVIPRDVIKFSPATSQCVWVTFYKIFSEIFGKKNAWYFFPLRHREFSQIITPPEVKVPWLIFTQIFSNLILSPGFFYDYLISLRFTPRWPDSLYDKNVDGSFDKDKVIWRCWWHEIFTHIWYLCKRKQRVVVSLIGR